MLPELAPKPLPETLPETLPEMLPQMLHLGCPKLCRKAIRNIPKCCPKSYPKRRPKSCRKAGPEPNNPSNAVREACQMHIFMCQKMQPESRENLFGGIWAQPSLRCRKATKSFLAAFGRNFGCLCGKLLGGFVAAFVDTISAPFGTSLVHGFWAACGWPLWAAFGAPL